MGEVCEVMDVDHKMPRSQSDGIPFISAKDLVSSSDIDFSETKFISEEDYLRQAKKCAPKKNDVLFSRIGTIGVARLVRDERKFGISYSLCIVRPSEKIAPEYLETLMNSEVVRSQATVRTQSIAVPDLGLKQIENFLIPLPPIGVQQRIGRIYQRAKRLQGLRGQANQLTNKIVQSVFLKMFGDPTTNPMGWQSIPLGEITELTTSGATPTVGNSALYANEQDGVPFFRIQNIGENHLIPLNLKYITKEVNNTLLQRSQIRPDDVLMTITGRLGTAAVVPPQTKMGNINQHICLVRLRHDLAEPTYIAAHLNSEGSHAEIMQKQHGATRIALNHRTIRNLGIMLPPLELQRKFRKAVERIGFLSERQQQTAEEINQLFHSLMHKAFRGELSVANSPIQRS